VAVHDTDVTSVTERSEPVTAEIGSRGRTARIALTVAAVALLIYGTVAGSNDMFPFGPFSMYAGRYPATGVISSNQLMAQTAAGRDVVVTEADTGLTRAEMEGELHAFTANPARLGNLAQAFHRRHPRASPYVRVWIAQQRWRLHERAVVRQWTVTLAEWRAR
jgi:hypothetical protein